MTLEIGFSIGWYSASFGDKETKGQWNKLKIWSRDETGWDSLSKSGTGRGTGQYDILTASPISSRGRNRDRAENDVLKQEKDILKQKRTF